MKDKIIYELKKGSGKVFLTGQGGTGKTYLVNQIKEEFNAPVLLGTTGTSAVLIDGQTIHSFFKIGICKDLKELKMYDAYRMQETKKTYEQLYSWLSYCLSRVSLIIIDEVSMMTKDMLDLIEFRMSSLGHHNIPILMVGDFLQLPPVNSKEYLCRHSKWNNYTVFYLEEVKRTTDVNFINILNDIRMGVLTPTGRKFIESKNIKLDTEETNNAVILFPHRAKVDAVNKYFLQQNENELHKSLAIVDVDESLSPRQAKKEIEDFFKASRVMKELEYKLGSKVMFIQNSMSDNDADYVNGDIGRIVYIDKDSQSVIILRDRDEVEILVTPTQFEKSNYTVRDGSIGKQRLITVTQFPFILSYAMTIHKSQGQSLDNVFINCEGIFESAMFYVALSRARNPDKLVIRNFQANHIKVDPYLVDYYKKLSSNQGSKILEL